MPLLLQIETSNKFLKGMWAVLAVSTLALGPLAMINLYAVPYWINVVWLDAVTYLHHHGPHDNEPVPWYRGKVTAVASITVGLSQVALYISSRQQYPALLAQPALSARSLHA